MRCNGYTCCPLTPILVRQNAIINGHPSCEELQKSKSPESSEAILEETIYLQEEIREEESI